MSGFIGNLIKREKGSQTLEFIAVLPLFIMMLLMIWQFALAGYTKIVAISAAYDGARAAAAGNNGILAAEKTAYGFKVKATQDKGTRDVTITVFLDVPLAKIPFLEGENFKMSARATMPMEKPN